jgi:hypothetical protein
MEVSQDAIPEVPTGGLSRQATCLSILGTLPSAQFRPKMVVHSDIIFQGKTDLEATDRHRKEDA